MADDNDTATVPEETQVDDAPTPDGADPSPLRIERRDDVAIIWFDVPGEAVNTLKEGFDRHFEAVFAELEAATDVSAVVLASGKPNDFIAGADVSMLRGVRTAADATRLSRRGHEALEKIESFRVPVVAAIHGSCLGGGLEVALACRARVASSDPKTKLGLPEVMLGVIPGAAGTQRLPRLIGIEAALDLILTGKKVPGKKAKALGLVDDVVPASILVDVAIARAKRLAEGGGERRSLIPEMPSLKSLLLEDNPIGRKLLFSQAKKQALAKTHGNYPAPLAALEVIRIGAERGLEAGLDAEAEAFGDLVVSSEARRLMGLFFAQNELKKDTGVDDESVEARPVHKIGVLGAGLMGAGIAYVTADLAGIPVRLRDMNDEAVCRGLKSIRGLLQTRVDRRRLTPRDRDRTMARVRATTSYTGFKRAEVVIEAVFEDISVKRSVLAQVEEAGGPEVIFASNTSSLPIHEIAAESDHKDRVIGMHYFSPVDKMPLLEIIVTPETADWVTATCVALGKRQGKTVIVVNDGAGFYTSRIVGPYGNEAAYILAEGVPVEVVDRALVDAGYPVGPVKLLDEVGIDVAHKVGKILVDAFGARMAPPPGMEKLIADERFGRKNGRGFYQYGESGKGDSKKVDESVYAVLGVEPRNELDPEEIALRCTLQMVNEAAHCYGEGILRSARDGDIGAVFGLGFPPFTGGPFRWVDGKGAGWVVEQMERLRGVHGDRFAPAPVLVTLAENGVGFHDEGAPAPGEHRPEA